MSGIGLLMMSAGGFIPTFNEYTGSGTETVPAGASSCVIHLVGAGGAGGRNSVDMGGGGGGAGFCSKTIAVVGGDTFSYATPSATVGRNSNGIGATGGNGTVTGTVSGGSVSLTANGGAGGQLLNGGAGGTATGGDTNTTGTAGEGGLVSGAGGPSAWPDGGNFGQGGQGTVSTTSRPGEQGKVRFSYT